MKVLQLTVHYSPNIGGVETHLSDLVKALTDKDFKVIVLTYRPLMTLASWKLFENSKNLTVIRIPYIRGLFYKFIDNPLSSFVYLIPGLFIALPLCLLFQRPDVIHTHGLVGGFVGIFWGRIFGIRTITTTHNIYNFPKTGLYRKFAKSIFSNSDHVLTLSEQSRSEIASLGVSIKKITRFTYWIDLNKFKKQKVTNKNFNILFVGRLVEIKGVKILVESAKKWNKNINLLIAGDGPLKGYVKKASQTNKNIKFLGKLTQNELPHYYSNASLLIVPSTNEEGFGRVIIESLACGTPVIGANKGGIPEAIDETVGELINVSEDSIKNSVEKFYKNRGKLDKLTKNTRKFAVIKYSEKNVEQIINSYTKKA